MSKPDFNLIRNMNMYVMQRELKYIENISIHNGIRWSMIRSSICLVKLVNILDKLKPTS